MKVFGWVAPDEHDPVTAPAHYAGAGCECKEALASMLGTDVDEPGVASYWRGCAFKYLWRYRRKNGLQDLMKCRQCIDELIAAVEEEEGDKHGHDAQ